MRPRASASANHRGVRPRPLKVSSGFSGWRYRAVPKPQCDNAIIFRPRHFGIFPAAIQQDLAKGAPDVQPFTLRQPDKRDTGRWITQT